jgi:hypothetical protein
MLENAGAIVFTPRERDWQKEEIIVDNDGSKRNYVEVTSKTSWKTSPMPGFMSHSGSYSDGENPFVAGSARMCKTTSSKSRYSLATYQPDFKKAGRYAVYVSYQTLPNSIDDALYTVWHRGERTQFLVNQQMGGSTWVYLGTFDFDAGYSEFNRVTVSYEGLTHPVAVATGVVIHSEEKESMLLGSDYLLYADPTDNSRVNNCQLFVGALFPEGASQTKKQLFDRPWGGNEGHLLGIKSDYKGEPYTYYFGSAWSKHDVRTMTEWQERSAWTLRTIRQPLEVSLQ